MKKIKLLVTSFILIINCLQSQDYKFGKVALEDVQNNTYTQDTSAAAVMLYKSRNTYFNYEEPHGWIIMTEIHERIKVLKKSGFKYANRKIDLYKSEDDLETVTKIKGYTHNLKSGKVKSEKLKKDAIFENDYSQKWNNLSFTMPNVQIGSVLEWHYIVRSPFYKIEDLVFQEDIPIRAYYSKIQNPDYFNFKRILRTNFSISPKDYSEKRTINVTYDKAANKVLSHVNSFASLEVVEFVSEYRLNNMPALINEPYVDNIKNYVPSISYELESTDFPGKGVLKYSTTWEVVVKTIYDNDNFGKEIVKAKFLTSIIEKLKADTTSQVELMNSAFNFIKDHMTWDGKYGKYTKQGIEKAYKESTGNVAEINLMLLALLKQCGIEAYPILASTRDHVIPLFPTLEGFNYVVVGTIIEGKLYLMDATEKMSIPNVLPKRVLNWEGTLVNEDGSYKKVNLYPKRPSRLNTIMTVEIKPDASITGNLKSSYSDLEALSYRKKYTNVNKEQHVESIIKKYNLYNLSNLEVENIQDLDKSIIESYTFEVDDIIDVIGDKLYVAPLFFLTLEENPFKLEERNYPIDFVSPFSIKKMINVKIPEGYTVDFLPEPIKISLPDNEGSFIFNINKSDQGLNIITNFKINAATIPAEKYLEIKKLFDLRLKKESEKIVLKKV